MAKDWQDGGDVDGEPALTYEKGDRTEALYPLNPDGTLPDPHDHVATNDALNASYLREGDEVVVDDNPRSTTYTGTVSSGNSAERIAAAEASQRSRRRETGGKRGRR